MIKCIRTALQHIEYVQGNENITNLCTSKKIKIYIYIKVLSLLSNFHLCLTTSYNVWLATKDKPKTVVKAHVHSLNETL